MLEALSIENRSDYPKGLLCADDLVLVSETRENLQGKLEAREILLELIGLRVNVKKTKLLISNENDGKVS